MHDFLWDDSTTEFYHADRMRNFSNIFEFLYVTEKDSRLGDTLK